jgi:hypothetical protein
VALTRLLPLDAATYEVSPLHADDRMWQETNCYADVWIELLHGLGLDPIPALPFLLSTDFDGDQWRFFKFPLGDLWSLYGIAVMEMNPWRGVEHHVIEQLAAGRSLTVEVDSWFLPDTAGVAYQRAHVKSTIATNMIDPEAKRLGYFHNMGYHELEGADYEGVFRHHLRDQPEVLVPYVELVRLEHLRHPTADEYLTGSLDLMARHLARRPTENPVQAMRKRIDADIAWLQEAGLDQFHDYAFATLRQCGANAELAASYCTWLDSRGQPAADAAQHFADLSSTAKTVQFKLARIVAGRSSDLGPLFDTMEQHYEQAVGHLADRYAR